jgi:hypothetical protein
MGTPGFDGNWGAGEARLTSAGSRVGMHLPLGHEMKCNSGRGSTVTIPGMHGESLLARNWKLEVGRLW